jgi:site-specific DNA recombinase
MARVSLPSQAEKGYSLETQIELLTPVIEKNGYAVSEDWVLRDDGYQGNDWNRPAINRGLDAIREGKVKALAFINVDRFARDVEGGLALLRKVRESGGIIIFGDLGPVSDDANFRLMLHLRLMIAEYEKSRIKTRSREVVMAKVRNLKQIHGGKAPYGYTYIPKSDTPIPHLKINPDTAPIVRLIFAWYDVGCSLREIVKRLSRDGIQPPGRPRQTKKNSYWAVTVITRMIRNEAYIGDWHYNKCYFTVPEKIVDPSKTRHRQATSLKVKDRSEWIRIPIDPIVDRAVFARCNERLSKNKRTIGGRPSDRYLLKGLVWCAKCGKRFCGARKRRSSGEYQTYYNCTNLSNRRPANDSPVCTAPRANGVPLENLVWDETTMALGEEETLTQLLREHERATGKSKPSDRAKLAARIEELLENELQYRTDASRVRRSDPRARQIREHYAQLIAESARQRDALSLELAKIAPATNRANIHDLVVEFREGLKDLSRAAKQKLLSRWVSRVEYYDGEVSIHLAIPLLGQGAAGVQNCNGGQPHCNSFIPLILHRRVA